LFFVYLQNFFNVYTRKSFSLILKLEDNSLFYNIICLTAGEETAVACGSAKTLNLPEWAKLSLSAGAKSAGNAIARLRL
jgi:hypothetical protein